MANYWFKRRRYGYGWYPVTWQGWAALGVFAVICVLAVFLGHPRSLVVVALATVVLLMVCRFKGPSGRWRWGPKPTDSPEEDW